MRAQSLNALTGICVFVLPAGVAVRSRVRWSQCPDGHLCFRTGLPIVAVNFVQFCLNALTGICVFVLWTVISVEENMCVASQCPDGHLCFRTFRAGPGTGYAVLVSMP